MLARIAEFVIEVEESSSKPEPHLPADTPHFGVPEVNRIHCLSLNIDKAQRIVWVIFNRRAMNESGDVSRTSEPLHRWRIDSTILTWGRTLQ
jgi:hypothetical protein